MTQNPSETPKIQEPRKFFIIYKRDSAGDLAKHLHDALHERGVDVFLDTEDLKEGLLEEEWRKQIDDAIEEAQVFVFIVTHSASASSIIKRELKKVRDSTGKEIKAFVHYHIWGVDQELAITLDGECVDIRSFQVRRFDTREELVREVADSTLIMRIIESN